MVNRQRFHAFSLISLCLLLGEGLGLPAPVAPLAAQEESACATGRISQLFVDNHSVFDISDPGLSTQFTWAYRLANRFHIATRDEVIRREILFEEGDCYEVDELRDSERLVRGLGFIADVDIFGVRQPDSTIHVIVDTRDEWSLRVEPRIGGGGKSGLTGFRLQEENFLGTGTRLAAFYRNRAEDQVYGASVYTPQLFASRWDGLFELGKTPEGYLLSQALTYPFVAETGRWAFRQAIQHNDRTFEYRVFAADGITRLEAPETRTSFDVGAVYRWGPERYRQSVIGAVLRGDWVRYPDSMRYADADLRASLAQPVLASNLDSITSVRAMLLVGQRNVYYVQRRGLDTVRGTEDVRLGVESQFTIGPSVPIVSEDRDLAMGFGMAASGEFGAAAIAGASLSVEARRDYESPASRSEWSDVFGRVSGWAYLRGSDVARDLLVASVGASGGWQTRVPFQLTLGSEAGLRGHPDYVDPGARRVVASLEHRRFLGWPFPELFDLGTVLFVDAGKMWAGDAAFGVTSPVRAAFGVGLRSAFPPGSRRTLRVDVGAPADRDLSLNDLVLTVGIGQWIGRSRSVRDPQLDRSVHIWNSRSLLGLQSD